MILEVQHPLRYRTLDKSPFSDLSFSSLELREECQSWERQLAQYPHFFVFI